jgi:hypothetical protein
MSMLAAAVAELLPALMMTRFRPVNMAGADDAFNPPHPCNLSSTKPQA